MIPPDNPSVDVPPSFLDVFLQPGEMYWGDENTRIRTLLGSCVSIVIWHPLRRIGGMSHIMLPRGGSEPKYANGAMEAFLREMQKSGSRPGEYTARVFGGGNMFSILTREPGQIGEANVLAAFTLIRQAGIHIAGSDIGGLGYRKLIFDLWNGHVWMKKQETVQQAGPSA